VSQVIKSWVATTATATVDTKLTTPCAAQHKEACRRQQACINRDLEHVYVPRNACFTCIKGLSCACAHSSGSTSRCLHLAPSTPCSAPCTALAKLNGLELRELDGREAIGAIL
jgi:hypothetical protein